MKMDQNMYFTRTFIIL